MDNAMKDYNERMGFSNELTSIEKIIEACFDSGLASEEGYNEFSITGCEYCHVGSGNIHEMKGYTSLSRAQHDSEDYYEFDLCPDCLYKLTYGE